MEGMADVEYMHTRQGFNMQERDGCMTPPVAVPVFEVAPTTEASKRGASGTDGTAAPAKKKKVRHILLEGHTKRSPGGAPKGANRQAMPWNYWTGHWDETGPLTELQAARAAEASAPDTPGMAVPIQIISTRHHTSCDEDGDYSLPRANVDTEARQRREAIPVSKIGKIFGKEKLLPAVATKDANAPMEAKVHTRSYLCLTMDILAQDGVSHICAIASCCLAGGLVMSVK